MQFFGTARQKTAQEEPQKKRAHVIVTGNEKGGSGKTTTTMHLIVALLRLGFKVGTMDIDSRQRTLSRYMENRRHTIQRQGAALPEPVHLVIQKSPFNLLEDAEADENERFTAAITRLMEENDFVIIDSPGNDTYLSRLAHSYADTVITPINDSFVDLDVLATVDGSTLKIIRPSIYSEMVWEQKLQRAKRDQGSIDWIVMRNRMSNIEARNKRFMTQVLTELSRRIGFRVAPGFSERVIYRELFLQGLTVLDVMDVDSNISVSMSHVAARQEVRELLKILNIDTINQRIEELRKKPEKKTVAIETGGEEEETAETVTAPATATSEEKTPETVAAKTAVEAETKAEITAAAAPSNTAEGEGSAKEAAKPSFSSGLREREAALEAAAS